MNRIFFVTMASTLALSSGAWAERTPTELEAIKAEMTRMMQRINSLENNQSALKKANQELQVENSKLRSEVTKTSNKVAAASQAAKAADSKDATTIPGTNTTIKLGGYIKADAIADVGTGYGEDFAKFAAIPLEGSSAADKDSDFHIHARHTRINVTTTTPTAKGDVMTFLEADLFGTRGSDLVTNGHAPQLRQAYGQWNGLLAGQTWSTFMDMAAYPESLDFIGPVGITLLRQPQVRYSDNIDESLSYSLALENPNADFTTPIGNRVTESDRLPDVVAALTQKTSWGHWSARALAREISVEDENASTSESALGYGVSLSSRVNLWDKDNLMLRASYGDGMGRYIYDIATSSTGAAYNNGELETQKAFAGYASYQHFWTDELRSNLMGGYANMDNATSLIGTEQNETIWSGHANLIWQPVDRMKFGMEYIHGYRELENGAEGELDRVMGSFIYNLN